MYIIRSLLLLTNQMLDSVAIWLCRGVHMQFTQCVLLPVADEEEEQGDWLYLVIADIISTHNHIIQSSHSMIQAKQSPLHHLFPEKPAKISVAEVASRSTIVSNSSEYAFGIFEINYYCHAPIFFAGWISRTAS